MTSAFHSTSLVNAYTLQISDAFNLLARPIPAREAETLACFLLKAMGSEAREYHRPEHSLDVSKGLPPVASLAALFHDIVYVQVDPSWEKYLADLLDPFIPGFDFTLNVKGALSRVSDPWIQIIVKLFGFENEVVLMPKQGLNEFLSAIIFVQKMRPYLTETELLKGLACIEATIPFRKTDEAGFSPAEKLSQRIEALDKETAQGFFKTPVEIESIIQECKKLIHNDLISFGSETAGPFLANTWNVIIENFPTLRNGFFSLREYREAMVSNIEFFSSVDLNCLYWTDPQQISEAQSKMIFRTGENMRIGSEYLKAIVLTVTLLEAIADQTGGDAPFELFLGPMRRSREHEPVQVDRLITFKSDRALPQERKIIFNLLKDGRSTRSRFDHKTSALSAFVYANLSLDQCKVFYSRASELHQGKYASLDFILQFTPEILTTVFTVLEQTALSRKDELARLFQDLNPTFNLKKIA